MNEAWNAFSGAVNLIGFIIIGFVLIWTAGLRRLAIGWVGLLIVVLVIGPMVLGIMAAAQTVGGLGI